MHGLTGWGWSLRLGLGRGALLRAQSRDGEGARLPALGGAQEGPRGKAPWKKKAGASRVESAERAAGVGGGVEGRGDGAEGTEWVAEDSGGIAGVVSDWCWCSVCLRSACKNPQGH